MDDLRAFADAGTMARRGEGAAVQDLLDDELDRYLGATSAREVAPMIIAMRSRAEEVRRAELERFRSRLDELEPAHLDVIAGVTRGILAKLLHEPTVELKDAAGTPRGDRLGAALRRIGRASGRERVCTYG